MSPADLRARVEAVSEAVNAEAARNDRREHPCPHAQYYGCEECGVQAILALCREVEDEALERAAKALELDRALPDADSINDRAAFVARVLKGGGR